MGVGGLGFQCDATAHTPPACLKPSQPPYPPRAPTPQPSPPPPSPTLTTLHFHPLPSQRRGLVSSKQERWNLWTHTPSSWVLTPTSNPNTPCCSGEALSGSGRVVPRCRQCKALKSWVPRTNPHTPMSPSLTVRRPRHSRDNPECQNRAGVAGVACHKAPHTLTPRPSPQRSFVGSRCKAPFGGRPPLPCPSP